MHGSPRRFRLGLQAKVLIVVVAFLVLVPLMTVWIVGHRMQQQMEEEAVRTLATAESVFLKSLENRTRTYLARYESIADEARFRVTAELGDRKTTEGLLAEVMDDAPEEHEIFLIYNARGELAGSRRRGGGGNLEPFEALAERSLRGVLAGEPLARNVSVNRHAYSLVAEPVSASKSGGITGALIVGVRLGEAALQELKLPRTEILLLQSGDILASTVAELPASLLREESEVTRATAVAGPGAKPQQIVMAGEHFMARSGALGETDGATSLGYLMLSSYEQRLRALDETRRTIIELSVAGVIISALVVAWLVGRVTRPLRELRDSAEAVGRGDFSRKISGVTNDECGDLAESFNRMTGNLESSRAALEQTVATLKTTQTQLIQSEKLSAVGQFVAGVAHELNNPLTAVIGFSDLLAETAEDKKIRPQLEMIVKSAHRCHKIVQNLLSFARQHPPERKFVRLRKALEEVLEIMLYDFRTSNVTIARKFDDVPPILADGHQLQQVFINILSNARQALQPFRRDGEITIRLFARERNAVIEFTDNGPGIRPEHLSKIFDPFFTTKAVGKGTGLGMSLAYGIVHEHGGRIGVTSAFGQGATFTIELPFAEEVALLRPDTSPAFSVTAPNAGAGSSVLVIDDEDTILRLVEALLRTQGYDVEALASGEAAVERLKQRRFDVIVSDWKMPGLGGIQLYEHLKQHDPESANRMLFMTGDVISGAFEEFLRQQTRICLAKPFSIDEFRAAVRDLATGEESKKAEGRIKK